MKNLILRNNLFRTFEKSVVSSLILLIMAFGVPMQIFAESQEQNPQICESHSYDIYSDGTTMVDGNPAVATWAHPLWATIDGATWIWSTSQVSQESATNGEVKTFTKDFEIAGTPTSATLQVAADNDYKVVINSTDAFTDTSGESFFGAHSHDALPYIHSGSNTISFEATNWPQNGPGQTPEDNPAGLIYKLHVESTDCGSDTTAPDLTFLGFRDQANAGYDNTQPIKACGATNTTGSIAWEWQLNNVEVDPVTYAYKIISGPTAVGYMANTPNTYYNGNIPAEGTYVVEVTGTDSSGNVSAPIQCSVIYTNSQTDTTPPSLTFLGFRDQDGDLYDDTRPMKECGALNETGAIAFEWQLNPGETDPVAYYYKIISGPTFVGWDLHTPNTHHNGNIPSEGTFIVEVTGTDSSGNVSAPIQCSVTGGTTTGGETTGGSATGGTTTTTTGGTTTGEEESIIGGTTTGGTTTGGTTGGSGTGGNNGNGSSTGNNGTGGGTGNSNNGQVLGAFIDNTAPKGKVLGANSCSQYINTYIKYNNKNNSKEDVKKLQIFLNEHLGLKLKVDGEYGVNSYNAVKAFQKKYKDQVLNPWIAADGKDISKGTGYVYKTTVRWINLLKCPELNLSTPIIP